MIVNNVNKAPRKFRLRTTLVVPFVLQIVAAVGLVGYISFRNGQQAVNDVATQLRNETSDRIKQNLTYLLAIPFQSFENYDAALSQNRIDLNTGFAPVASSPLKSIELL